MRKILFIAEGYLGDCLVLTPALKAAKEQIKDSFITVLLLHRAKYASTEIADLAEIQKSNFTGTSEVFKENPYVDEVLELDRTAIRRKKGFSRIRTEIRVISFLRKKKFDAVVCTFPQDRFVLWSFLAGIKKRIGQQKQKFSYLLTDKADINKSDSGVLKYMCNLLSALNVTCRSFDTIYNISIEAKNKTDKIFNESRIDPSKKIICIHPGASNPDRQWSPKNFSELIGFLKAKKLFNIILCHSKYDSHYINELKKYLTDDIPFFQTDNINDLAAILEKCDLAVVHNSGPRHLAAAIGTKTLALLEKHDDIVWKVYEDETINGVIQSSVPCKNCSNSKCLGAIPIGESYGARCIRDITVNDVYSRIETIFNIM